MFDELKTAQAAAYLLNKAGGTMDHLKLMKLLYLADRLSWEKYDQPISGDEYYSLPYGPVLSKTLDLMRGEAPELYERNKPITIWAEWIADKENYKVSNAKPIDLNDEYFFDRLSPSDEEVLDDIHNKFGHFGTFALVSYTHNPKFIPEWEEPNGSRKKIELNTLLTHLEKTPEQIKGIYEDLAIYNAFDDVINGGV
ncbi:Uncharacterized phage-associated protein [Pasteurella testudinis DSM 23072]|uniref:Uncharacterized phage-associated protein n=1 Tax=Pasteurella testudinis DSM 23072 TaxID=1122938 RepID=A0A1W1V2E9_9PAST|nr:Panacea domain-containing protein [Pasteurella testudinis]SMB87529.1 Uncharacterized phage-associated protein [Pasteurella testudinis DSM 23072]SUB50523.1 Uncharacterized phage-associated protein [Pasteurella testudinis]